MARKKKQNQESLFESAAVSMLEERDLAREMETSYLEYSMSVIVARALPDVRDGLKPVQRRILWGMRTAGVRADGPHRKCAKVVGEVMGAYHPHGDSSIYDALVRMAQPFSYYVPLVDGQGNFGSPGFPPAAMRYTECRMSPTAAVMLDGIAENTVDFVPTYDGETEEPSVMPAGFPNLLVNGAEGIAVGMTTRIPTHNPLEVIDAALLMLDKPTTTAKGLLRKLKGPDFSSGCDIYDSDDGILSAYKTGEGRFRCRATLDTEAHTRGATKLVFRNLPPAVSVARVADAIVEQIKKGKLAAISNVIDASDKSGQELHVIVKKGHPPAATIRDLYRLTQLETQFSVIMRALVDGVPVVCGAPEVLTHFCEHRIEVVLRRSVFRKEKAEARRHIVQALIKALDNIDAVIAAIKASKDVPAAKEALIDLLDIDDIQAQAIVDMQLRKLTSLETKSLKDELAELDALIKELNRVIKNEDVRRGVVRDELKELRGEYKDMKRRSRIVTDTEDADAAIDAEDAEIEDVSVQARVLRGGWIEVTPPDKRTKTWRGTDADKAPMLDEHLSLADRIVCVTDDGRAWTISLLDVPQGRRVPLSDLCDVTRDAAVIWAFRAMPGTDEGKPAGESADTREVMVTTSDAKTKRVALGELVASTRQGLPVVKLAGEARLVDVAEVADSDTAVFVGSAGNAARVSVAEIPRQSRTSAGVRAVKVAGDEQVVAGLRAGQDDVVMVATAQGWTKCVSTVEVNLLGRGGRGVSVAKTGRGRGDVVDAVVAASHAAVCVVDDANKVQQVKAVPASRASGGKHVADTAAALFNLPQAPETSATAEEK